MVLDNIADLLTRIRNAQRVGHKSVPVLASTMTARVLDVMKAEGFIDSYEVKKDETKSAQKLFTVWLKYFETGEPAISSSRRVSTSGRRIYKGYQDAKRVQSGLGISIISTSQGVMSDREARRRKIGGEILLELNV
jgi:small subunit ribosomal protein S8